MKEKAIDKRMASATVDIETCKKCERKFRKSKDDSLSVIYARALEDATRDVVLTASDYEEIAAEMRQNQKAREAKRKAYKSPVQLVAALTVILLSGCASIDRFYTENPNARQMEFLDYDGPLKAEQVAGMDLDALLDVREADDYFLIGAADYNGPGNVDWTGAMVRLGRRLKAEKIDYFTWYLGTESGTNVIPMPTMQTSTAAVWGPNGLRTVNVTTTGTTLIPYRYNIPRNEFHVLYFKKLKEPPVFGIAFGPPDGEVAKKIGTRNALTILRVVPGKIAWKNDLFEGDIIMEVDGQRATAENVLSFCKDSIGKRMKIRRGDKEIEITIKVD